MSVGCSLMLLVLIANGLVDLYARAVVRDALDEGVRAGVVVGATAADCEQRANDVLAGLLRGPVGDDIVVRCEEQGGVMSATASVSLASWIPAALPAWEFDLVAEMARGD
jgi:hypothetical protein